MRLAAAGFRAVARVTYAGHVRSAASLLACTVALAPLPAAADPEGPPPPAEEESYRQMSARTGLDLLPIWEDYVDDRDDDESFLDFTRARFRKKRNTGIILLGVSFGLLAFGGGLIAVGLIDEQELQIALGAAAVIGGVSMAIPGGVLLGVYQGRINTLKETGYALGPRLRLRAAGPIGLPRGAGLGLTLAF